MPGKPCLGAACPLPPQPRVHPIPGHAHTDTLSFQFFIVLLIILLAELILLILFFVYMDKVALQEGRGIWRGSRVGLEQRRSRTDSSSEEGRKEDGSSRAGRGPDERSWWGEHGGGEFGGRGGAYYLCSLRK